jgi:hypothetical protein
VHAGQSVLPQGTAPGQIRFAVAALFRGSSSRVISKSVTGAPGVGAGAEGKKQGQPQIPPLPLHYVQGPVGIIPLGEVARPGGLAIPRAGLPWDLHCLPARLG